MLREASFVPFALLGAIGWTVLRTREYPPDTLLAFDDALDVAEPRRGMLASILRDLRNMPLAMRALAPVQFFAWLALFSMWIYTTAVVTQVHFGTTDPHSDAFNRGANWVGVLFGAYNGFAALANSTNGGEARSVRDLAPAPVSGGGGRKCTGLLRTHTRILKKDAR